MILKTLALTTSLTALMLPFSAFAQDGMIDKVIVTAQKRAQNVQDVPISVTTVAPDTLDAYLSAAEDIRALATRVPGLYAESSNGRAAPRFYIRGLGNTDFDLAASQPVSIIMDEVVQENVVLKSFPLFDVASVEVLRGPQGSLYGRNTPAGIVKFDTVRPSDVTSGYISGSTGTYGTSKVEAAIGGELVENVDIRLSGLWQHRNDWIDNGFTQEEDVIGGFDDFAVRFQANVEFSPRTNVLFNVHARDLDGTSSLFRANVFDKGSNELNAFYDRDTVFFDDGDNNQQQYSNTGASAKITHALTDTLTLTSITGWEAADGTSFGDIDGGAFTPDGPFPGFIPFPSATRDGIDDLDQFTQEVRLTSDNAGPFNFQLGGFLFDSKLVISTDPGFAPPTTVRHDNKSWSLFGQGSYDLTDALTFTGGLRYTDDEKDFVALAANFPVAPVETQDDQLSYDASLAFDVNPDVNLFARYARGFRAPTIQGRDVAFFGSPTTAGSETIDSFEVGVKSILLDNSLRFNATAFYYDANDLQFSAIGGLGNFNQLVNADGRGYGVEGDIEYAPTANFTTTLGFSWNDTKITEDGLLVAPCGSDCTVLDLVDENDLASIEGNPFPQAPDITLSWTARYAVEVGAGELYGFTDWYYQGDTNFFLYESAEFNSDGNVEGGLRIGYLLEDGKYDLAVFARNITNEDNVKGGIDFNNLTGFVNEPRVIGVAARANF
ncbi:MAG: TonB-dependent receptor [Litorimonas sp.]